MNKKLDKRIKYTKIFIKEAFIQLMEKRDISKITVTELCKIADINRATFYKYYLDIYDLLYQIETELYNEFKISINNSVDNKTMKEFILNIITVIYNNKDICKILISDNNSKKFIKKIFYLAHDKFLLEWKNKLVKINLKELEYVFSYMANGSIGIIQEWILNDCKETPINIAEFIEKISNYDFDKFI